jgi:hypothetical protein
MSEQEQKMNRYKVTLKGSVQSETEKDAYDLIRNKLKGVDLGIWFIDVENKNPCYSEWRKRD